MPRIATKLTPAKRGGFVARKVIPSDVREEYAKLYGQHTEERLSTGAVSIGLARARHREWSSEIEARIANIRAARRGEGRALTPKEARALAGEWYHWFIARQADRTPENAWAQYQGLMIEEIQAAAISCGIYDGDPMELLDDNAKVRERLRPVIADEAKSEQFLAAKRLVLDSVSRSMFLDFITRDFFAAIAVLARRSRGDYGLDEWAQQFPQGNTSAVGNLRPWALFERWVQDAKPAISTIDRWRGVFLKLESDFPSANAASLLPEQMHEWAKGLINAERSPHTVAEVWVRSCRTVFGWALEQQPKLITRNPFVGWRVKVPRKIFTRETKSFTNDEMSTILSAASKIQVRSKAEAAKRWCPWLAAYSGARMGELTQLRDIDITQQDGILSMKISPEAGTTKTGETRVVPLHEHLVEQGFLDFVKASGKGPLFYNDALQTNKDDSQSKKDKLTNPPKPRYVKAREHVAGWVRGIGVSDPQLSPTHAWRHTFKAIAFRNGMSEKIIDAIVGHAPASVGRGYGAPTLADKACELSKFPRLLDCLGQRSTSHI